jgi:hypothetical protein
VKVQCKTLEQEVASLKSIEEMRIEELNSLRTSRNVLERDNEDLRRNQECIRRLKNEREELQCKLANKEEMER